MKDLPKIILMITIIFTVFIAGRLTAVFLDVGWSITYWLAVIISGIAVISYTADKDKKR